MVNEKVHVRRCLSVVEIKSPYGNFPVQCVFARGHSGDHGNAGKDGLGNVWRLSWMGAEVIK